MFSDSRWSQSHHPRHRSNGRQIWKSNTLQLLIWVGKVLCPKIVLYPTDSHRDTEESAEPYTDTGLGAETADAPRDADAPSAADTPNATDAPSAADAPRAADVPSAGDPPSAGDAPSNVTAATAEDRKKEPPRATNRWDVHGTMGMLWHVMPYKKFLHLGTRWGVSALSPIKTLVISQPAGNQLQENQPETTGVTKDKLRPLRTILITLIDESGFFERLDLVI